MDVSFKIKVDDAIFKWQSGKLVCDNDEYLEHLKLMVSTHTPKVVAYPDLVDYDDDLTDERKAYNAINSVFEQHKVIDKPSTEILEYDSERYRIY